MHPKLPDASFAIDSYVAKRAAFDVKHAEMRDYIEANYFIEWHEPTETAYVSQRNPKTNTWREWGEYSTVTKAEKQIEDIEMQRWFSEEEIP